MKMKKLIPALAMLLVSAILLGTSTYAWFSMNTTVTANSIQITAKSNARYLLINNTGTAASGADSLTLTTDATVYPASYEHAGLTLHEGETNELVVPANGWYTANNRNSNNATNSVFNESSVVEGDANYMATDTMYLTLSADSEAWANYVQVVVAKSSGDAAAKTVLKVTNNGTTSYIDAGVGGTFYIDCTTDNLTSARCITVVAYTYIDGDSTNVYSDFTGAPGSLTGVFGYTFNLTETNS
ncbi:MAG: hypothetical protein J5659_02985 [Clostridia bacterium]|nr:hypothetical protein [Clostridia bacterium]